MKSYEELFMESKGRPIIVNGEKLYSTDRIPVNHDFSIALRRRKNLNWQHMPHISFRTIYSFR